MPNADAVVGLTRNGFVFLLDRRTGAPIADLFELPGEHTPPASTSIPPGLAAMVDELLRPLAEFPDARLEAHGRPSPGVTSRARLSRWMTSS